MGMVPFEIQNQGSWEQLLRGNYRKGQRILQNILQQSDLRAALIADSSALAVIYGAINWTDASCLLAKVMDSAGETLAFNNWCRICGVSTGSTWAATCASSTAKAQIAASFKLLSTVIQCSSLSSVYGAVPPLTLDFFKDAIRCGAQAGCIGMTTDIPLTAFNFGGTNFAAGTYTFEVVGADQDVDEAGHSLPLTFFSKHLIGSAGQNFVQNSGNSNAFTTSAAYTNSTVLFNTLPAAWRTAAAQNVVKSIASSGTGSASDWVLPAFLYREVELFGTRKYSVQSEVDNGFQYQLYAQGKGTLVKKYANGTGSAAIWWECSPYSGYSTYFCYVNGSGGANYSYAYNSSGLCFGFCLRAG